MAIAHRILLYWILLCCPADALFGQSAPKAERLLEEKSPYLQRHADNLVEWYPWGDVAFEKAKSLNRPVFLTIGYSTSSWCSKMEEESFMNEEIAAFLNSNFICILVDREERPAIDNACVRYLLLMKESPSWPLHVFLTPDRIPLFGASYLSNKSSDRNDGQTLLAVLNHILTNWRRDTGDYLLAQSRRDAERMQREVDKLPALKSTSSNPEAPVELLTRDKLGPIVRKGLSSYDMTHGGRLTVPKFPLAPSLQWLHQYSRQFRNESTAEEARKIVDATLTGMAHGGIRDHVGGGFHRYAMDERWSVPSFEKMLYDQAFLGELYARIFAETATTLYKEVALEAFAYMTSRLGHPDGGFYTSEDAVSLANLDAKQPENGAYYSWTARDFDAALAADPNAQRLLKQRFGIRPRGNTPPGSDLGQALAGKNVLYHNISLDQAAKLAKIPTASANDIYRRGLAALEKHRSARPRPMVDKKILTSWNGYAIAALARGAVDLNQPALLQAAEKSIEFLFECVVEKGTGKLRHSWLGEVSDIEGICEDYAAMIDACLALYTATGDTKWLGPAQAFQQTQNRKFMDPDSGVFFDSAKSRTDIFLRLRPAFDADLISANALSARNLVRLSKANDGPQGQIWKAAAEKLFAYFETTMYAKAGMTPGLLAAWEEFTRPG